MNRLPTFISRLKFYHRAPQVFGKYDKTGKRAIDRAKLAKLVLLPEVGGALMGASQMDSQPWNTANVAKHRRKRLRIALRCATAVQIERDCGFCVNIIARRNENTLSVRIVNVGDTVIKVCNVSTEWSETIDAIVLPPSVGMRRWIGLMCYCVLEAPLGKGETVATFELAAGDGVM